jgi:hypothetical protein
MGQRHSIYFFGALEVGTMFFLFPIILHLKIMFCFELSGAVMVFIKPDFSRLTNQDLEILSLCQNLDDIVGCLGEGLRQAVQKTVPEVSGTPMPNRPPRV